MSGQRFISYGQNNEDVVLWRALQHVVAGHYVEVGANHPTIDSATRAFYDRGWSGLTVEPVPQFAALHREQRPRDRQVEVAVTSAPVPEVVLHVFPDTGLSTLVDWVSDRHASVGLQAKDATVATARLNDLLAGTGWGHDDIQFMLVDVEGAEADVLSTIDLAVWRPWVLVIEATAPTLTAQGAVDVLAENTAAEWEPGVLAAGYQFCFFDGVSRFYVAEERADLRSSLSYPACALDNFVRYELLHLTEQHAAELAAAQAQHDRELDELRKQSQEASRQSLYWRTKAIRAWGNAMAASESKIAALEKEIDAIRHELSVMRGTISWRVTAPLRKVRNAQRAITRRAR